MHFAEGSQNGSRYIIIVRAMTFSGGQEGCRGQGGHLVHINTVREQVFLQEYLERELKRVGMDTLLVSVSHYVSVILSYWTINNGTWLYLVIIQL